MGTTHCNYIKLHGLLLRLKGRGCWPLLGGEKRQAFSAKSLQKVCRLLQSTSIFLRGPFSFPILSHCNHTYMKALIWHTEAELPPRTERCKLQHIHTPTTDSQPTDGKLQARDHQVLMKNHFSEWNSEFKSWFTSYVSLGKFLNLANLLFLCLWSRNNGT